MDFEKYLIEQMLILIPVLYIVGALIKNTPKITDWVIPWILLVIGVAAAIAIGLGAGITIPDAIIQGVLVTGVTVLTNQLIKQTKDRD
ncbi:MAG: phage holin family protein [Blautia sp.]|nr:phage holin family protein [Blautia sp.]